MLALWSPEEEARRRVREHLPEDREVRAAGSWEAFRRIYPRADSGVVVAPDPGAELLGRIDTLKRRHPEGAVVLVTRRDPSNLRRIKDLVLEEIVWTDALDEELDPALRRADAERRFRRLGAELEADPSLPPTLVSALTLALRRRPPFTSVQALATEVERDRRTLWHHWRNVVGAEADLTLKELLDRILLLRAGARKTGDGNWREIADELGVHPRTLRRIAGRHLERPLRELSEDLRRDCFDAFEREVRQCLLDAPAGREDVGAG